MNDLHLIDFSNKLLNQPQIKMKNKLLFIAFLTLCSVSFMACSSDDNDGGTSGDIVGKWSFEKTGIIVEGQEVGYTYPHSCSTQKDHIEFKSNGSGLDYRYNGACELDEDENGWTWTVSGSSLKITDEHGTANYEILTLNNSTLKVKSTDSSTEDMFIQFLRM